MQPARTSVFRDSTNPSAGACSPLCAGPIKKFIKNVRRYRTIQIQADEHFLNDGEHRSASTVVSRPSMSTGK